MSTEKLIMGIHRGDTAALETVVREYRESCVDFVAAKVLDAGHANRRERAGELFAEALIALVDNVRSGRLTGLAADLGTYLTATMKYRHFAEQRRRRRPPLTLDPDHSETAAEIEALTLALRRHLRELGDRCRRLLTLFYFDRLPYEEIVRLTTGTYPSVTAARMQKSRCLATLRRRMTAPENLPRHAE